MKKLSLTGPYHPSVKGDYRKKSREFLAESRERLAAGELHRASENGWRAAAWMVMAVAKAQGWSYKEHDEFDVVVRQAGDLTVGYKLHDIGSAANDLYGNFFIRKRFLDAEDIGIGLDDVAELLDILEPLTAGRQEQAGAPSLAADS